MKKYIVSFYIAKIPATCSLKNFFNQFDNISRSLFWFQKTSSFESSINYSSFIIPLTSHIICHKNIFLCRCAGSERKICQCVWQTPSLTKPRQYFIIEAAFYQFITRFWSFCELFRVNPSFICSAPSLMTFLYDFVIRFVMFNLSAVSYEIQCVVFRFHRHFLAFLTFVFIERFVCLLVKKTQIN